MGQDLVYFSQGCGRSAFVLCAAGRLCREIKWNPRNPHAHAALSFNCPIKDVSVERLPESEVRVSGCGGSAKLLCLFPDYCRELSDDSEHH